MAVYEVSTTEKKSVEEREFWYKDGKTIIRINGFRWGNGTIVTEGDEELDFNEENPDGVNVYDYDFELGELDDGWYGDVEYPEDMPEEEQERMTELWDEEYYEGWENEGWVQSDGECWFYGALDITKVE